MNIDNGRHWQKSSSLQEDHAYEGALHMKPQNEVFPITRDPFSNLVYIMGVYLKAQHENFPK